MALTKINGSSYYIPSPNNIGVFLFKDKYALLVDSGSSKQQARRIDEDLKAHQLTPKYLFYTHHHGDHCSGDPYFRENYPGCQGFSSAGEKLFLENPKLFSLYTFGGYADPDLARHLVVAPHVSVEPLEPGPIKINNEKFTVVSLPGHSPDLVGIVTRDRVAFLGDALFSETTLKKYAFPYLFCIEDQFKTYKTLENMDADYFLLAHGEKIYSPESLQILIHKNRDCVMQFLELTEELLKQSKTREDLMEELIILNDLNPDFKEYYFLQTTIAAMVSYLHHQKRLSWCVENGRLFYYRE